MLGIPPQQLHDVVVHDPPYPLPGREAERQKLLDVVLLNGHEPIARFLAEIRDLDMVVILFSLDQDLPTKSCSRSDAVSRG